MTFSFRSLVVVFSLFIITGFPVSVLGDCPPGMSSYWSLDEPSGDVFSDNIGSNQMSCQNGCPLSVSGLYNGAQDFSAGLSDTHVVTDQTLAWPTNTDFTVEYWLKRDSSGFSGQETIISRYDQGSSVLTLWSGLDNAGKAMASLTDVGGNGPAATLTGSSVLTDGQWHHIVLIRDAANSRNRLYVDGVLEDEQSFDYPAALGLTGDSFAVGWNASDNSGYFSGVVDELATYSRPLSPFEIDHHYTDGLVGLKMAYCGTETPLRIMPVGDSITAGYNTLNWDADYMVGYRQKLYLDLTSRGYQVDFVGSFSSGELNPPVFDYDHEGHGGWTDALISYNIHNWLQANPPDIVLLHAGTNFVSPDPVSIVRILDEIDRFSEDIVVVLAKIINKKTPDPDFSQFNQNIEEMALTRIIAGDKIIIVDQENALVYPDDMDDELHPLQVGYEKMAEVWESALETILPVPDFSPPSITSNPSLLAFLNTPYHYLPQSSGMPAPVYRLIEAPDGMTIDERSGRTEWIPDALGQYSVVIEASNAAGSVQQDFMLTVTDTLILDTGDPGTSSTGFWGESGGADPYGSLSLWSREIGAEYTFQASLGGSYEVSLWWTEFYSRCAEVPVEIYDGDTLLDRVQVNQQTTGGQWNPLGIYDFTQTARVVIQSEDSECSTNADAARYAPKSKPSLVSIQIEGPETVNKNSSANYTVLAFYADGTSQYVSPDSWADNSLHADISSAGLLTTFDVSTDQPCQLNATYTANGITRTDSFDLTILNSESIIIDTGEPGTSAVGVWSESSGLDSYGSLSLWSRDVGTHYDYQTALAGTYEVSLWWTEWSSRCTSVPVEISDGSTLLDRVLVNQQFNGGQWNSLGVYNFAGIARVSIISETPDCSTNADAVQFALGVKPPLDRIEIEGPLSVNKNSTADYSVRAYYADGSSQLVVSDSWSDDSVFADISQTGVLSAFDVSSDQDCQLSVSYTEGDVTRMATFNLTILGSSITVIDTGDPGTSYTGTWSESGGPDSYETLSLWSREPGMNYTYQAGLSGDYETSIWWTEWSSRCTAVPVEIYDGTQLLDRVLINQQNNGGQWNSLGVYNYTGTARIVILSESAACSTNADAVKFAPGSKPALDYVQIEGPVSVAKSSSASYSARAFYVDGSSQLIVPDNWSEDSLYADISADGTFTTMEVPIDQPCRLSITYTENTITRTATFDLTISSSDILILDTGEPGTSSVGFWDESAGPDPYGALSLWSREVGASYSFSGSAVGSYRVDLWWTSYVSRCSTVTVDIYDNDELLGSVSVNQQFDGGIWNSIGQYTFTGTARATILSESTACSTNADAFRLVPML